jgi:hypothetical protein
VRRVLGRVLGCVCAIALALTGAGSAQAALTAQPVAGTQELNGIACSLPFLCVAVGSLPGAHSIASPAVVPVILGKPSAPEPAPGGVFGVLNGVACSSVSSCVAVGSGVFGFSGPVVQISGVTPTGGVSAPTGTDLYGVGCQSATACIGVGQYSTGAPPLLVALPVGGGTVGAPGLGPVGFFRGVACPLSTECFAAGTTNLIPGPGAGAIVPIRNGTIGSPVIVAGSSGMNAIACRLTTSCVAVGDVVASIFAGAVTGTRTAPANLKGVACPRQKLCLAVGNNGSQGVVVPIFQGIPLRPVPVAGSVTLNGITCPRRFKCIAVGQSSTSGVVVHVPARILALY